MQRLAILFLSYILSGCMAQAPAPIEFKSLGSSGARHAEKPSSYTSSTSSGIKKRQIVIESDNPQEETSPQRLEEKPFETVREIKEEPKKEEPSKKEVIDTKSLEDEMSDQDEATEPAAKPAKKEVGDVIAPNKITSASDAHFAMPTQGEIVSKFGEHYMGKKNNGINIAAKAGSDVKAVSDGVVIFSGEDPKFGNLIIIKHDTNDLFSAYAHMSDLKLHLQDRVTKSQVIGHVGQTGNVTKPQLHFAIRKGKTPVDPMQYLK